MYETQLLREGSMERQELILKYFYMIDPAQIINQLAEHPIPKDTSDTKTIDDFFHTIFEKIYRASTLYDRYLDPTYNSFDSFFGEPGCTSCKKGSHNFLWLPVDWLYGFYFVCWLFGE